MTQPHLKINNQKIKKRHTKGRDRYKITIENPSHLTLLRDFLIAHQMSFSHFMNVYFAYFLDNQNLKREFITNELVTLLENTPKKRYQKSIQLVKEHIFTVKKELQNTLHSYLNSHKKTASDVLNEGLNQFFLNDELLKTVNKFFMLNQSDQEEVIKHGGNVIVKKMLLTFFKKRKLAQRTIIDVCKKKILNDLIRILMNRSHPQEKDSLFYSILLDTVDVKITKTICNRNRNRNRNRNTQAKKEITYCFKYEIRFFYTSFLVGTCSFNQKQNKLVDLYPLRHLSNPNYSCHNLDFSSIQFERNKFVEEGVNPIYNSIDELLKTNKSLYSGTPLWEDLTTFMAKCKKNQIRHI